MWEKLRALLGKPSSIGIFAAAAKMGCWMTRIFGMVQERLGVSRTALT